jgi:hypothetical protein
MELSTEKGSVSVTAGMLGKSLYYLTAGGECKSSFPYTQRIRRGGNTQVIPTSFERKQTQSKFMAGK